MKKILILLIFIIHALPAANLGTYFTYQGELIKNGIPANGQFNIIVNIYDAQTAGTQQNGQNITNVTITNGLFNIQIDVGDMVFLGQERWLELTVTDVSGGNAVTLQPRQLITNAPYAIHAQFVGTDGVDSFAIQNGSVTTAKLANAAVTTAKLAVDSVTSTKIANAAVTSAKLAGDSVTSAHIANGTISTADIATASVTRIQIAADTIEKSEIATGGVGTDEIENGTILAEDIDSSSVQQRVSATCPAGSSIRVIAANGSVTCETDDTGGATAAWGLTGNSGTTAGTNYIGTADNTDLIIKVNNTQAIKIQATGSRKNIVMGENTNQIGVGVKGSLIASGQNNSISASGFNTHEVAILSGESNSIDSTATLASDSVIAGGRGNVVTNSFSTIGGGADNRVQGAQSTIAGGRDNFANGTNATVPGGGFNRADGTYSFAAGKNAQALHDGSWVWSDASASTISGVKSTADNQFLIRAVGGVGIGINAPVSPFHLKGQGTSTGSTTNSNEVVMTVEPRVSTDGVAIVVNKLATNEESALMFSTSSQPQFDIRTRTNGTALDFNSYAAGSPSFMMRINDKATNRIDFNSNIEPQTNNNFNFGSNDFRWATIFTTNLDTTNAVNVTSDRRLKDNIKELDYGLAEIMSMKPVTYSMKSDSLKKSHMGLIAQEVETIIPEIVNQRDDEMHTRSMRYGELIPVLIKATQEQQILIEQQNQIITKLESMVEKLLTNKTTIQ